MSGDHRLEQFLDLFVRQHTSLVGVVDPLLHEGLEFRFGLGRLLDCSRGKPCTAAPLRAGDLVDQRHCFRVQPCGNHG